MQGTLFPRDGPEGVRRVEGRSDARRERAVHCLAPAGSGCYALPVQRRLASLILLACLGLLLPLAGGPLHLCLAAKAAAECCEVEAVDPCCCGESDPQGDPCCIDVPELPDGLPVDGAPVVPAVPIADLPVVTQCGMIPELLPARVTLERESIRPPPWRESQWMFGVWRL